MLSDYIAHRREKDGKIQNLSEHLESVSKLTGEFASKIGLREHGELIGFIHDIGKTSREFQDYIKSAVGLINPDADEYVDATGMKGKVDHSTAGAQFIYRKALNKGPEDLFVAQILSLCIASHHSGIIDCLLPDGKDNFRRRMNKTEQKAHSEEIWSKIEGVECERIEKLFPKELSSLLLSKLKSLQEENDSKESLTFKCGLLVRFLFSCLIDADRLNTSDFEFPGNMRLRNKNKYPPWDVLITRFNAKKFDNNNEVDVLRSSVSQQCLEFSKKPKGLYQLTVPTGGGKTFASLRFALHHSKMNKMDRIIYVIPYTSIIDQNADEVRKVLEEKDGKGRYLNKVVLEQHSNLTPEEETRRQNLLSENWDAPIVFTTNVQFLETFFASGTQSARRMHQLANAVIIFDEVQTIPIRCVHMFNVALRFLIKACKSTAILCTATQPLLDKIDKKERSLQILPNQQMIQDVKGLFRDLKRVEVYDGRKVGGWTDEEVVNLAGEELLANGSVLIIVNTKLSAKNFYQQLKKSVFKDIFHLSTDMCPDHRMRVLSKIKDRLKNCEPTICVSTQLIEAGIDIDFGSVIRALAGLDSIAQAAGRCNRHGLRSKHGNVFIVNPKNENLSRLEEIRIGAQKAARILDEFKENPEKFDNEILSPAAMEQYYQYYFYERKEIMNFPVTSRSSIGREDDLFSLLSTNPKTIQEYQRTHLSSCDLPLRQSFHSAAKAFHAIESSTRGVVVPYGKDGEQIISELCAAYGVEKQYKLIKKAQRYSVNVYENVFNDLAEKRAIHEAQEGTGIFYLDSQYYSDEFGLSKEIINEMPIRQA